MGEESTELIQVTRREKGRVIAVGTTSLRVLESPADIQGGLRPGFGSTGLFVLPGYHFKTVDALITNFHAPRSTLLMLVSAFDKRERILSLYGKCLEMGYFFLSYGDAMFLF